MRTNLNKYNYICKAIVQHFELRWTETFFFERSPTWIDLRWRGVQGESPAMSGDNGLDLLIRRFSNVVGKTLLV